MPRILIPRPVRIIAFPAGVLGMQLDVESAREIALRSRGTPRITNRLLRRVRDYSQVRHGGAISRKITGEALDMYEVDPLGLDRLDRAVLESLCVRFGGGPVGLGTLAMSVGEEVETVEEVAEPFLIRQGFLMRTPRGRVATNRAWAHLGLTVPASRVDLFTDPDA